MSNAHNSSASAQIVEGGLTANGLRTAIIASRFNSFIVEKLVDGALDTLVRHGADKSAQQMPATSVPSASSPSAVSSAAGPITTPTSPARSKRASPR